MRHLSITFYLLSVLILLGGCSGAGLGTGFQGGTGTVPTPTPPSPTPAPPPAPNPAPSAVTIDGNWNFSITPAVPGTSPITIGGIITQSGNMLGGVVHVNGWNCFDNLTAISLSGNLTEDKLSLTSTAVNGQVITVTGIVSKPIEAGPYRLSGTYSVRGGCADSDQGSVTGNTVDSVARYWGGNFTAEDGTTFYLNGQLDEDGPSSEGSYGISGQLYIDNSCLKSGTITPGTFPDASYILGSSVVLEIKTDNGVIKFVGMAAGDGLIRGIYKVDSGPCTSTGTGYLSPWD